MIQFYLWVVLRIWDLFAHPSTQVINNAKIEGKQSFEKYQYRESANNYKKVVDASFFSPPEARLNLANAYFMAGEKELAKQNYQVLRRVDDNRLVAKATFQLGVLALEKKDTLEALAMFRESILADRSSKQVIASFEILRHHFSGNTDNGSIEVPNPRDTLVAAAENSEVSDLLRENIADQAGIKEQLLQNLDKINMSEEQAKSILDAMKVNERQYIYQLRRLGNQNGAKSSGKVEW